MARILIGGDVTPTDKNMEFFRQGDAETILGKELYQYWKSADYRLFNLECALTDRPNRIIKNGPHLVFDDTCLHGIEALNPSLVLLANNHILDAGEDGLSDLLRHLDSLNINYIGAGNNISLLNQFYVIEADDKKIGIFNCCDHEFSIAGADAAGANPFTFECLESIKELSVKVDYTVVAYHGGKEYYRYPSPLMQHRCRQMVDYGANLVLCQHSHCIGSLENYNNATILYGQGNFIFNKKSDEYWDTSLLVELDFNNSCDLRFIPIIRTETGTMLPDNDTAEKILHELHERSKKVNDPEFIERNFSSFATCILPSYLYAFSGWSKYRVAIDKKLFKGFFIKRYYSKKALATILNFITCEAHHEVVEEALRKELKFK